MSDFELDEVLFFWWPTVMSWLESTDADAKIIGFSRSIAREGRRVGWRPSKKQARLIAQLLGDYRTQTSDEESLIDDTPLSTSDRGVERVRELFLKAEDLT